MMNEENDVFFSTSNTLCRYKNMFDYYGPKPIQHQFSQVLLVVQVQLMVLDNHLLIYLN